MPSEGTQGTIELRQFYNGDAGDNFVTVGSHVPSGSCKRRKHTFVHACTMSVSVMLRSHAAP